MSISTGSKLLWSDIKKLYTDAYDTGSYYNGHFNYLYAYGPRYYHSTREDSGWRADQTIIPDHLNRIINGFNNAGSKNTSRGRNFRRSYNNNSSDTTEHSISTVSSGNIIYASNASALRTYLTNSLNYTPCNCNCNCDGDGDCQCDSACNCMECNCNCK